MFGAPGIVLKGSGFYKTDTRAQDKRSSSDKSSRLERLGLVGSGSDTKTDTGTKSSDSGSRVGDRSGTAGQGAPAGRLDRPS